jgi:hypothetical protein
VSPEYPSSVFLAAGHWFTEDSLRWRINMASKQRKLSSFTNNNIQRFPMAIENWRRGRERDPCYIIYYLRSMALHCRKREPALCLADPILQWSRLLALAKSRITLWCSYSYHVWSSTFSLIGQLVEVNKNMYRQAENSTRAILVFRGHVESITMCQWCIWRKPFLNGGQGEDPYCNFKTPSIKPGKVSGTHKEAGSQYLIPWMASCCAVWVPQTGTVSNTSMQRTSYVDEQYLADW